MPTPTRMPGCPLEHCNDAGLHGTPGTAWLFRGNLRRGALGGGLLPSASDGQRSQHCCTTRHPVPSKIGGTNWPLQLPGKLARHRNSPTTIRGAGSTALQGTQFLQQASDDGIILCKICARNFKTVVLPKDKLLPLPVL